MKKRKRVEVHKVGLPDVLGLVLGFLEGGVTRRCAIGQARLLVTDEGLLDPAIDFGEGALSVAVRVCPLPSVNASSAGCVSWDGHVVEAVNEDMSAYFQAAMKNALPILCCGCFRSRSIYHWSENALVPTARLKP